MKIYVLTVSESDGDPRLTLAFTTKEAAEQRATVEYNNSNSTVFTEIVEVEVDPPCPIDKSEVATLAEVYFGSKEPDDITKWVYDKYEQRRVPGKHRSGVVATAGGRYLFWNFNGSDALGKQIVDKEMEKRIQELESKKRYNTTLCLGKKPTKCYNCAVCRNIYPLKMLNKKQKAAQ